MKKKTQKEAAKILELFARLSEIADGSEGVEYTPPGTWPIPTVRAVADGVGAMSKTEEEREAIRLSLREFGGSLHLVLEVGRDIVKPSPFGPSLFMTSGPIVKIGDDLGAALIEALEITGGAVPADFPATNKAGAAPADH